jgi:nucleoside-diphosphate-sugar epimerase
VRVFLTGGTGLLGSHTAEQLRSRGDEVLALVRESSDTRHLERLGCALVVGDVMDEPSAQADRMGGCDAVVHAAARVFERASRREFLRPNVEGTRRVLEAAARAAPRVVHLSSVAVYSGLHARTPLVEDRWRSADPDAQPAYPASKTLSERAAWELHRAGRIRLTTLRPSVVYGERDRAAVPIFVRVARLPVVPLPGGGAATVPVVYAGNVAAAVVAALDREGAVGRAYNVARDVPLPAAELLRLIGERLARPARILPVPAAPLEALAAGVAAVTRLTPGVRQRDARRFVRSLSRDNPYDSARARLELGWTNLIPHAEGVRRTMEWWNTREAS